MADQLNMVMRAVDGITPALSNISKNMDRLQKESERTQKKMDALMNGTDKGANKAAAGLGKMGAALSVAGAYMVAMQIKNFTVDLIQNAAGWERLSMAITTMEGSSQRATAVMGQLYEAAKVPGVGLKEIQAGYLKFKALRYEAEDSIPIFQNLGNAIASTGGSAQQFESVVYQLTQMVTKNKLLAEDISVIGEHMPALPALMEKAFGTSNLEKIRAMGIGAREFVKAISDAAGTLPKAAETMANSIDNLDTAWSRFKAGFVNTAFVKRTADFFTTQLERMTEAAARGEGLLGTGISSSPIQLAIDSYGALTREVVKYTNSSEFAKKAEANALLRLNHAEAMIAKTRKGSVEQGSWKARAQMARQEIATAKATLSNESAMLELKTRQAKEFADIKAMHDLGSGKVNPNITSTDDEEAEKDRVPKSPSAQKDTSEEDALLESIDSWGARWEDQYQIVGELRAQDAQDRLDKEEANLKDLKRIHNIQMKEQDDELANNPLQ